MAQQLSLSARPRDLDSLVGQSKIVAAIRGHMASGRVIKSWMFCGPKGAGKTSLARILALSYQCEHQEVFGKPCKECRLKKSSFSIYEIPASIITGKDDIKNELEGSGYGVLGSGKYRVYILDEAHGLSKASQNLLLDYLESSPETAIFILVTTQPQNILDTVRRRCMVYELRELELEDMEILVPRLLKTAKSDLPADRLIEALNEKGVRSPGLIAQAVEKYVAGNEPEDAAQVEGVTSVDVRALTRSLVKGDWNSVATYLQNAQTADVKAIRLSVIAYLRTILLEDHSIKTANEALAKSITLLCQMQQAEDLVVSAGLAAELYKLCVLFDKFKR